MTGTVGDAFNDQGKVMWLNPDSEDGKNPVKVPGYYWKAVCYPGNEALGKKAWAYGLIEQNINEITVARHTSILPIKGFNKAVFADNVFGPECMEADLGDFQRLVFPDYPTWKKYLSDNCSVPNKDEF